MRARGLLAAVLLAVALSGCHGRFLFQETPTSPPTRPIVCARIGGCS